MDDAAQFFDAFDGQYRCVDAADFGPIALSISAKLPISGSMAAFSITVVPRAKVAAIKMLRVAPTEAMLKSGVPPEGRFRLLAIT